MATEAKKLRNLKRKQQRERAASKFAYKVGRFPDLRDHLSRTGREASSASKAAEAAKMPDLREVLGGGRRGQRPQSPPRVRLQGEVRRERSHRPRVEAPREVSSPPRRPMGRHSRVRKEEKAQKRSKY